MTTLNNNSLSEKDFIHNPPPNDPFPYGYWLSFFVMIFMLMWGIGSWYQQYVSTQIKKNPFLQVTNREFSLFLWENPEYMRSNYKVKSGYLPGFEYLDRVGIIPEMADFFVLAPPEIIFLYHVWHRLVGSEKALRPIPVNEFIEFLQEAPEWDPKFWPLAPKDFVKLVNQLSTTKLSNLQDLPETALPNEVRKAFQGWKNFFKEGEEINAFKPTYELLHAFLKVHPNYTRSYWRNIELNTNPHYLYTFTFENFQSSNRVPPDQMAPFLKVALFNASKSSLPELHRQSL